MLLWLLNLVGLRHKLLCAGIHHFGIGECPAFSGLLRFRHGWRQGLIRLIHGFDNARAWFKPSSVICSRGLDQLHGASGADFHHEGGDHHGQDHRSTEESNVDVEFVHR